MTIPTTEASRPRRPWFWVEIIGLVPALAAVVLLVGVFAEIPYVSTLATTTIGFVGWALLACLVLLAYGFVLLARFRTAGRWMIVALSGLAVIGTGAITAQLYTFTQNNDAPVNPWAMPLEARGPDHTAAFFTSEGTDLHLGIWMPAGQEVLSPEDAAAAQEEAEASGTAPAPTPILVHVGGEIVPYGSTTPGASGETPSATDPNAQLAWFAEQGWVVVDVGYERASSDRATWNHAVGQVECALAFVAERATQLGGSADAIALMGESTGGGLVVNATNRAQKGEAFDGCGAVPTVAGVVAEFPVLDASVLADSDADFVGEDVRAWTRAHHDGDPQSVPDNYTFTTSTTHVTPGAPPTLLLTADRDHLVPAAQARDYEKIADRSGGYTTIRSVPHAEHGFTVAPMGDRLSGISLSWLEKRIAGEEL